MIEDKVVKGNFDPASSSVDSKIREVFADDYARTVYLTIAPGHLISTAFSEQCLSLARGLRHDGIPEDTESLSRVMRRHLREFDGANYAPDTVQRLHAYLTGEAKISYQKV